MNGDNTAYERLVAELTEVVMKRCDELAGSDDCEYWDEGGEG